MWQRGFTLIELLIVLAVSAILLAIAVPGYQSFLNSNKLAAVTNELVTDLHLARSEAIKRGQYVTVCKTNETAAMLPACVPSAAWQEGWLVFVDGGTQGVIEAGDTLLHVRISAGSPLSITASNFNPYVSYRPSGVSKAPNGLANGALRLCLDGNRRDIIINTTGRIRLGATRC